MFNFPLVPSRNTAFVIYTAITNDVAIENQISTTSLGLEVKHIDISKTLLLFFPPQNRQLFNTGQIICSTCSPTDISDNKRV